VGLPWSDQRFGWEVEKRQQAEAEATGGHAVVQAQPKPCEAAGKEDGEDLPSSATSK